MSEINKFYTEDGLVICQECGKISGRIYGRHMNTHNMTSDEYKAKYPGAPVTSKADKASTSKNSGQHMKTEKYKKMFSEMYSGEKNAMHKSKRTEKQRKENSPFSMEFYRKRFPNSTDEELKEMVSNFVKSALTDRVATTDIQYYINQGMNETDAAQALIERQTTFSKDICIAKYGEKAGLEVWITRQEKWHSNYKKSNFSKISQELYVKLYNIIKHKYNDVYFATLDSNKEIDNSGTNHEYRLTLNKSHILPDFFIPEICKIIEFDGTYYHRPTPENLKREAERDKNIIDSGYQVLHITEAEYKDDKRKAVQKCLDFLKS